MIARGDIEAAAARIAPHVRHTPLWVLRDPEPSKLSAAAPEAGVVAAPDVAATVVALAWANLAPSSYSAVWDADAPLGPVDATVMLPGTLTTGGVLS